jgi:hypothetical protein
MRVKSSRTVAPKQQSLLQSNPFCPRKRPIAPRPAPDLAIPSGVSDRPAPKFHRCSDTALAARHHKPAPHRHCCRGRKHDDGPCPDDARRRQPTAPRITQSVPNLQPSELFFSFSFSLISRGARPGALRLALCRKEIGRATRIITEPGITMQRANSLFKKDFG